MRKCKWCGNSGWFLAISKDGFCQSCESSVKTTIINATQVLNESLTLMKRSNDLDLRLSKSQLAIEKLRELVPYFEKGLVNMKPSPQEWVAHIYHAVREMVNQHISGALEFAIQQARHVAHPAERAQILGQVSHEINKYETQLGKAYTLRWRKRVEAEKGYLISESENTDEKEEEKERALAQYLEALDILRSENSKDPEQIREIAKIEKLITDLGGEVPDPAHPPKSKAALSQGDGATTKGQVPDALRIKKSGS